jgi:hypothetical protein
MRQFPGGELFLFFSKSLWGISVLEILLYATCFFCLLAALGVFSWLSTWIVFLLLVLVEFPFGRSIEYRCSNAIFFALGVLCLTRNSKSYPVWKLPNLHLKGRHEWEHWPSVLLMSILPIVYLLAAISKIRNGGLGWLSGETLYAYLYLSFLSKGNSYAAALLEYPKLMPFMAVGVVLFEAFAWVLLLRGRFTHFFLLVILVFHGLSYFVLDVNYFWMASSLFWIYVDFAAIYRVGSRWFSGLRRRLA